MQEGSALRVLLVSARAQDLKALGGPLAREQAALAIAKSAAAACEALQQRAFDVVVLSHPLPDADPTSACAWLAAVPACPPILLLDDLDRTAELRAGLPAAARPARCLARPVDGAKLPALLRELIEESAVPAPEAALTRRELAAVLLDLARSGDTGVLEVHADFVATRVFVRRGAPIGVEGGSLRETLGRLLVRSGKLSERDYEEVVERMTERMFENEHMRMGEVLIELGLLKPAGVYEALSAQAGEKIVACLAPQRVEATFAADDALPEGLEPLAIPPFPALVVEAVKRHFSDEEQAELVAPFATGRVRLRDVGLDFRLEGADGRLAAGLGGARSAGEILRAQPEARATLAALALAGALEATEGKRARGGGADATPRPLPSYAREVVARRPRAEPVRLGAAPEPVAPQHPKLEAEQLFRKALVMLGRERLDEAGALLARAVALQPDEPEYRMHEAWVAYLAARVAQRIARARAIACARRMAETDPRAAKPRTILGRLLWDEGDAAGAARELELALVRDPDDEDAKKALAAMGRRIPAK